MHCANLLIAPKETATTAENHSHTVGAEQRGITTGALARARPVIRPGNHVTNEYVLEQVVVAYRQVADAAGKGYKPPIGTQGRSVAAVVARASVIRAADHLQGRRRVVRSGLSLELRRRPP